MYMISTADATSTTARFRMPALCARALWPESVSGAFIEARRVAGAVASSFGYVVDMPAPVKGATLGVRAWSPPV